MPHDLCEIEMNQPSSTHPQQCAAALSTAADTQTAVAEVCQQAKEQLSAPAHLAFAFVSPHHGPDLAELAAALQAELGVECLLGCTGESIVGGDREIEQQPALALWLAHLPGVSIHPLHLEFEQTPEGGSFVGWSDDLPEPWPSGSTLILLGEPFSFPADVLLARLNDDRPGVTVVGGMASGGYSPGENRLILNGRELTSGAVAVLLHGNLRVRSVVSQGCRPIGRPFVITKSQQNVIQELSGRPALVQLAEIFHELPEEDQQLIRSGLHVGCVTNEYQDHFERGDFLVRNVIGSDPSSGAIAVGDYVRTGQTVQFHVRDAGTADEDLRELLDAASAQDGFAPRGGLLFTCNGRGTRLFPEPHHDARLLRQRAGELPVAGFFAQGELGPVAGKNFLHGFTASVALFESRDES